MDDLRLCSVIYIQNMCSIWGSWHSNIATHQRRCSQQIFVTGRSTDLSYIGCSTDFPLIPRMPLVAFCVHWGLATLSFISLSICYLFSRITVFQGATAFQGAPIIHYVQSQGTASPINPSQDLRWSHEWSGVQEKDMLEVELHLGVLWLICLEMPRASHYWTWRTDDLWVGKWVWTWDWHINEPAITAGSDSAWSGRSTESLCFENDAPRCCCTPKFCSCRPSISCHASSFFPAI